jgi:hypothetical protein
MPKPNFFIVGAPKSGTSSMHDYLSQHPSVFMSALKEPIHFGRDLAARGVWAYTDDDRYSALFDGAADATRIGESTTWYLYSTEAAAEIHAFAPQARIIAMLRHPVDAMYSLHGQFLYSGNEDIEDFEQALAAEDDRRLGRRIPDTTVIPRSLIYTEVFDYPPQVRRYFDLFGRDNVLVLLFDDFVRDTAGAYRRTLEFLGVDPTFVADLRVVNPAKPVSMGLTRFLARRPALRKAIHTVVPPGVQQGAMNVLSKLSGAVKRPAKIPADVRARLLPRMAPSIRALAELLGHDLSRWLSGHGAMD